jgi:hypothetical protein
MKQGGGAAAAAVNVAAELYSRAQGVSLSELLTAGRRRT